MTFYLVLIFLLILMSISKPNTILNNDINAKVLTFIILFFVSRNIIFREQIHDTSMYILSFKRSTGTELSYLLENSPFDIFWTILQWCVAIFTDSSYLYLAIIWFLFLFGFMKFLNKLFLPWQVVIVLFSYTTYVFFYSYTTMALRQGLSISFLFLALTFSFFDGKVKFRSILFLIAASLFHWTAIPFAVIVFVLTKYNLSLKFLVVTWFVLAFAFILNLQTYILTPFLNFVPKIDVYASSSALSVYSGNRTDFLLYSFIFLVLSLLAYYFYYKDDNYKNLIKYYIAFNSVYLLMGFVAYSDRIAGYSWFLIPIIIWYPILKRKEYFWPITTCALVSFIVLGFLTGTIKYYNLFLF
ncbi:hypothetical protein JOD29_000829 [Lysinibacillus composti]|uniref:EpsG family protein n=1 Tax=Lysinibacillus composti TaxID=720633 RepID=A0A3N9UIR4_9BACI|nr:EpsG family protein [Lysinibacillus composti]MBM7607585.1 hypothetical protein [Lysinibacillus composti]RQW75910.1 EpsG family protein [Lysinibacillus composti]